MARLQALAADQAAARRRLPWHRRPGSGLGVTMGAMAAASAQSVLAAGIHESTYFVVGAGCAWTLVTLASSTIAGADANRRQVLEELRRARRHRAQLERQIAQLEE